MVRIGPRRHTWGTVVLEQARLHVLHDSGQRKQLNTATSSGIARRIEIALLLDTDLERFYFSIKGLRAHTDPGWKAQVERVPADRSQLSWTIDANAEYCSLKIGRAHV